MGQFLTILYILLLSFAPTTHPYYVGVTEIIYKSETKTMEIAVKLFTDDFEGGLSKYFHQPINLTTPIAGQQTDSLIKNYIIKHLSIQSETGAAIANKKKQQLPLTYVGYEQESEAIWTYFEVTGLDLPQSIKINNTLLYNHLTKQINMMHITVDGKRKSAKLDYPESVKEFAF